MMEMIHESIDKQGMPYHGPVKGLISIADNKFRRNKGELNRPVPEQIEHRMMRQGIIINALKRYLWLNTPWLECRWVDSLDPQARMSRSAVIITVGRTGRVLARYELPMFALVGWTSGTGWPEKAITLSDTLGAQGTGLGVPQGERR